MQSYEKLGAFYLGRRYDVEQQTLTAEPLLYDAKDLTTHAVCVGMTGSGKTGLGVTLIEEAAIDGIPVIAIDPKGDMGNLLLTFPKLRPRDFAPWVDRSDAARHGRTPDEHAAELAKRWRDGLTQWGQAPSRISTFADAAERTIFTPGSRSGMPITVLRSFAAPPAAVMSNSEALADRVAGAASGLLSLVGIDADPLQSREHILMSTLLQRGWAAGQSLDLPTLIQQVQKPPIDRVGVLDLESFYPAGDRFALAMRLNNLLASPSFAAWTDGVPLDIPSLLWTEAGKPRVSVLAIAHLSEAERMFFVTMVLNEMVSWVRSQPGSGSLRAILYMDEIFGYFPPTANPPSKRPMLTLLKQARAHGLGVVLSTQNPVDLDYKGLSNAGTWFVGRLQTEQDVGRVMGGLERAAAGQAFDAAATARTLAGLSGRQFLMNNVHEDTSIVFQTRWALSYLAGPLTGEQITQLSRGTETPAPPSATPPPPHRPAASESAPSEAAVRPTIPSDVVEQFIAVSHPPTGEERLMYRPHVGTAVSLHYAKASVGVDTWQEATLLAPLRTGGQSAPWSEATEHAPATITFVNAPEPTATFADLPSRAANAKTYARWRKMLATHIYRERPLRLWTCRKPKLSSEIGEAEGAFRARLREAAREARDIDVEKLRRKDAPKLQTLQDRIDRAQQKVETEHEQYSQKKTQAAISLGATVLGAMFGRKLGSIGNLGRATTTIRGAGRASRERGDIARAKERVGTLREQQDDLQERFEADLAKLQAPIDAADLKVSEVKISPRKTDLDIRPLSLVWAPWCVDRDGIARPAFGD